MKKKGNRPCIPCAQREVSYAAEQERDGHGGFLRRGLIFLAVLILWGSLWSITVSCVGIGTFTNAVTALYFGRFAGRKSAVLAAAFALLINTAFLILRVRGIYLPRADDPSTAEQVGALLLIALSGVGLYRSIRRYKHS